MPVEQLPGRLGAADVTAHQRRVDPLQQREVGLGPGNEADVHAAMVAAGEPPGTRFSGGGSGAAGAVHGVSPGAREVNGCGERGARGAVGLVGGRLTGGWQSGR